MAVKQRPKFTLADSTATVDSLDLVWILPSDSAAGTDPTVVSPGKGEIIDHLGEPRLSEGLDGDFSLLLQAAQHPNLYVKAIRIDGISDQPWPHQDVHPYIKAVFEAFGPQRMLGCTGFPENPQRGEAIGFRVIEEGLDFSLPRISRGCWGKKRMRSMTGVRIE